MSAAHALATDAFAGLHHNCRPVRLVGRRPNGQAFVELLMEHRDRAPTPTGGYRAYWPHELNAPGVLLAQIRRHVETLPLVTLAGDPDLAPASTRGGGERPRGPLHAHHTAPED